MARKKSGTSKALSVSLSLSNFATLDELRWSHRKSLSEMLDEAVDFYIAANGIARVTGDADPVEAETLPEAVVKVEKPAK